MPRKQKNNYLLVFCLKGSKLVLGQSDNKICNNTEELKTTWKRVDVHVPGAFCVICVSVAGDAVSLPNSHTPKIAALTPAKNEYTYILNGSLNIEMKNIALLNVMTFNNHTYGHYQPLEFCQQQESAEQHQCEKWQSSCGRTLTCLTRWCQEIQSQTQTLQRPFFIASSLWVQADRAKKRIISDTVSGSCWGCWYSCSVSDTSCFVQRFIEK